MCYALQLHREGFLSTKMESLHLARVLALPAHDFDMTRFRREPPSWRTQVVVSSVDGYQGREADVIVFSAVRCNEMGSLGFVADPRRINVAITRPRRSAMAYLICSNSLTDSQLALKGGLSTTCLLLGRIDQMSGEAQLLLLQSAHV